MLPLAVPLFVAMAVGPVLSWKRAALWPALLRLWWAALIAAVVGVIAALGLRQGLPALGFRGGGVADRGRLRRNR